MAQCSTQEESKSSSGSNSNSKVSNNEEYPIITTLDNYRHGAINFGVNDLQSPILVLGASGKMGKFIVESLFKRYFENVTLHCVSSSSEQKLTSLINTYKEENASKLSAASRINTIRLDLLNLDQNDQPLESVFARYKIIIFSARVSYAKDAKVEDIARNVARLHNNIVDACIRVNSVTNNSNDVKNTCQASEGPIRQLVIVTGSTLLYKEPADGQNGAKWIRRVDEAMEMVKKGAYDDKPRMKRFYQVRAISVGEVLKVLGKLNASGVVKYFVMAPGELETRILTLSKDDELIIALNKYLAPVCRIVDVANFIVENMLDTERWAGQLVGISDKVSIEAREERMKNRNKL